MNEEDADEGRINLRQQAATPDDLAAAQYHRLLPIQRNLGWALRAEPDSLCRPCADTADKWPPLEFGSVSAFLSLGKIAGWSNFQRSRGAEC